MGAEVSRSRGTSLTVAALTLAGWAIVLRGLWFAPPSPDPVVDLEGGGGFAATVEVYLPAVGLSLVLLVLLGLGIAWRGSLPGLLAAMMVVAFALWTLSVDYLLDYLPSLADHLWMGIWLAAGGALIAAIDVVASWTAGRASSAPTPAHDGWSTARDD